VSIDPQGWRVQVGEELLDSMDQVGPAAFAVYLRLLWHAREKGRCWPSGESIAAKSKMDIRTVRRAIKKLESARWITVDRSHRDRHGHRQNVYTITPLEPEDKNDTRDGKPSSKNVRKPSSKNVRSQGTKMLQEQEQIEQEQKEQGRSTSKTQYPSAFEDWWLVYPRKVAKQKAFAAWKAVLAKNGQTADTLMEITRRFASSPAGTAGKFTPHPTTWLNQGRYDDDPAEWHDKEKPAAKQPPLQFRDENL